MMKSLFSLIFCLAFSFSAFAGNLYETLGVQSNATQEEIKKAWKTLVRKNHPDRFMGDEAAVKTATETLAVINAAETVIGNKTLRAYYDFISNLGQNHQRWLSTPGNSNEVSLKKMFGDVENLGKSKNQNPFTSARPQPSPKATPKASAQPSPSPKASATPRQEEKTSSVVQDPVFEFFRKNSATKEKWRETYRHYIVDAPAETDPARQMTLLKLLTVPMEDWKFEALARAVILKFETIDTAMTNTLKNILSSQDPKVRKIGVTLVHYAIVKERTQDLFKMDHNQAESYIVERMNDISTLVQGRSKAAVEKLGIKIQENFNSLADIEALKSDDSKIRENAFKKLFAITDLNAAETKLLAQELLRRNNIFNRHFLPHLPQEMTAILEILERTKDISAVAEELRYFRATSVSPLHRINAQKLEERAFAQKNSSAIRCEAVFR